MVDIVDGSGLDLGVIVEIVVHLLCACGECEGLQAAVEVLFGTGNPAGLCHVDKCIDIHLCVDAQILEVGLRDHLADGIGHTADAELEACAVRDALNNKFGNSLIDLCGRCCRR